MKIWRVKINSSVVSVNLGVFLAMAAAYIVAFITNNMAVLTEVFGSETTPAFVMVANILTIWLRLTNVQGLPPVTVDKPEQTQEQ